MHDTLWITLPVVTWRRLFDLANQENRNASDYLRVLIDQEAQNQDFSPVNSQIENQKRSADQC